MILQPKQGKRFYRLFDTLCLYVNNRLQLFQQPFTPYGDLDDKVRFDVMQALWQSRNNQQLIADFVNENPRGLSRTDLKEVQRWECALYGNFFVSRRGSDVFFYYAEHAIAVRGITREPDSILGSLPTMVETALLPFENAVVYAVSMLEYPVSMGPGIQAANTDWINAAIGENRVIRNSSQFVRLAPQLKEHELQAQAEHFAYQTELDMNADAQVEGQHRGALAGLDPSEKEARLRAYLAKEYQETQAGAENEAFLHALKHKCFQGQPAQTLDEAYAKLNKYELQDMARSLGITGPVSTMKKAELLRQIKARSPMDAAGLRSLMRTLSEDDLRDLQRLVEADGTCSVSDHQALKQGKPMLSMFPLTLTYHRDGQFVTVMPQEALDALAPIDWEAEFARAKRYDRIVDFFNLVVDLRGLVHIEDAVEECIERTGIDPSAEDDDFMSMLFFRVHARATGFAIDYLDEDILLIDAGFADTLDELSPLERRDAIQKLLDEQGIKPPRPVPDELDEAGSVVGWMLRTEPVQALVAYLDEHVPDGEDDYFFARDMVSEIILAAQESINSFTELPEILDLYGLNPTEAQLKRVVDLAGNVFNSVPKWCNNGWAPLELHNGLM